MAKNNVPILVKVISVLFYITAVGLIIGGFVMLLGAGIIGGLLASILPIVAGIGAGLLVALGILFILLSVLYFFVGRGLWKGKNWARVTAIVLTCIVLLMSLLSFNILGIIIEALIAGYLLFSKDVKSAFR